MKAAFLAFHGCAIWQVSLMQMLLRRHGWTIDTLTLNGQDVKVDGGVVIKATEAIDPDIANDYQLVMMAGGLMTEELAKQPSFHKFLRNSPGIIAASCASSVIVGAANLINGRFTAIPDTVERFSHYFTEGNFVNTDVCVDGNLITSKGYAHYDLTVAVLEATGVAEQDPNVKRAALKLSKNQELTP